MNHLPRLTRALRALLRGRRTAALATLDASGSGPFVSLVPFAWLPLAEGGAVQLVLHVSELAAHTRNLRQAPQVSLLVAAAEPDGAPVHDLARVTLHGVARTAAPDSALAQAARRAYLDRFPEAEPITALPDFRFVVVQLSGARQVAGFGAARTLEVSELALALAAPWPDPTAPA